MPRGKGKKNAATKAAPARTNAQGLGTAPAAATHTVAQQVGTAGAAATKSAWTRYELTAELQSDAHLGSGSGGGGIDALVSRDRDDRPVIWASHIEGVLRDAARRLKGDAEARAFFGSAGGSRQRTLFTSLYTDERPGSRIWRSTARAAFDNRAPRDDTLRVIEYVPKGTKFRGSVEVHSGDEATLKRLIQEVDAIGGGRSTGSGRVKLELALKPVSHRGRIEGEATSRLVVLLKNCDPLSITATATPDNLIPSLAYVPGRALLGAIAAWLIAEGNNDCATLVTSGAVAVSDALPLHASPPQNTPLSHVEVLPAPLTLQSTKPAGSAGKVPWWAQSRQPTERIDAWQDGFTDKLKRPEDDLFVCRFSPDAAWTSYRPSRRVRLRNGRPDPLQADASLFAIEQIVERTYFLAELRGSQSNMASLTAALTPVLGGGRWLRVGRSAAPVEVVRSQWCAVPEVAPGGGETGSALLTLTSDLLVRDDELRWQTELDAATLAALVGTPKTGIAIGAHGKPQMLQESVMVHGFNGTAGLWRMPAAAIRRGAVFRVSDPQAIRTLGERAAKGDWLGERTHEGFGHFRVDRTLPGVTGALGPVALTPPSDSDDERVAAMTWSWLNENRSLAKPGSDGDRKPSLSQWLDLVAELESGNRYYINYLQTADVVGARGWRHACAKAILDSLQKCGDTPEQARYARLFVRWLRAEMRRSTRS